ncbi:putative HTH-type transcriptional regulator YvdT [Planococcus massiliensis]|uniref:Putative HTH-type transcriptional regulator YvdT n=1 Tax=Planococcus massiliensis TaxID=1499687 RepID=A0A098EJ18_9BACL|nr:TetR family transcriptional regulator [Planococcus massiliensis]CEG21296.1 putative HTH-type transcriptional regulator YvdT [Planococcus massiliensis]
MNKKDKIISAAISVFRQKGIEKTTISDIVKEAGIAQGTFYLYFPSKMALMPAIAEILVGKMEDSLKRNVHSKDIAQQLTEIINALFEFTAENKDLTILMYSGLTQTSHLKDWELIYLPVYQWVENLLTIAQESNAIPSGIKIEYMARILIGMIEAAAEQNYLFNEQDPAKIKEFREELQKMIFRALSLPL